MACGALIKVTLFVAIGLLYVQQVSAISGSCPNKNSLPRICNCELYSSDTGDYTAASVQAFFVATQPITQEEFRPRVPGWRGRRNTFFMLSCRFMCLNHLRAKLQQENVVGVDEFGLPTSDFLTDGGKDNLCDLLFNNPLTDDDPANPLANEELRYYFLKSSRAGCLGNNPLQDIIYIGSTNCECYDFDELSFQKCYRQGGTEPSNTPGNYALL